MVSSIEDKTMNHKMPWELKLSPDSSVWAFWPERQHVFILEFKHLVPPLFCDCSSPQSEAAQH